MTPDESPTPRDQATTDPGRFEVPDELGRRLAVLFELDEAPATLAGWFEASMAAFEEAGLEVGPDALLAGEPTRHEVDLDGRSAHTYCLMDALVLPFVVGEDVEVGSSDPWTGEELRLEVTRDDVDVEPGSAVMSVGTPPVGGGDGEIEPGLPGGLDHDRAHDNLCPYINGFRTRENHDAWADANPGIASTAVPVEASYELARDFVRELP